MNFMFCFLLALVLLLIGNVPCQDSYEFQLPLPTELNISQGLAASFQRLDPKLGISMIVLLRVTELDSFQLTLIDKANVEVVVFELRRDPPKASVKYRAGEMTAHETTKDNLECSVPNNGTNFEFFIKLNKTTGPLEYSCGTKSLNLDATEAGRHLWKNLVRVRLTGEGSYSALTYVPVETPSVDTYYYNWEIMLPGKKHLKRGDVLEAAFKVKTNNHPYFFTLSASGSDDHWLCYVRTDHEDDSSHENSQAASTARLGSTQHADPMDFYRVQQKEFPYLSKLAMKYLCAPCSNVASERELSTVRDIVNFEPNRFNPENVNKLMFLQYGLRAIGFDSIHLKWQFCPSPIPGKISVPVDLCLYVETQENELNAK